MTDLNNEVQRGQWASEILENGLWREAYEHWREDLTRQLKELSANPKACQEVAQLMLAADKFKDYFEDVRDSGKLASVQLAEVRRQEEQKTRLRAIPGA